MTLDRNALKALARAYDREDASQRGEPDPWDSAVGDAEWEQERLACAQVGATAYLAALPEPAPEPTPVQPVAWQWRILPDEKWQFGRLSKALAKEQGSYYEERPLYATPPSAGPAAQRALGVLRECRKQINVIIEDGIQTDWHMWRDDLDAEIAALNAALAPAQDKPE